jgi:hypothetical protein
MARTLHVAAARALGHCEIHAAPRTPDRDYLQRFAGNQADGRCPAKFPGDLLHGEHRSGGLPAQASADGHGNLMV